MVILDIFDGRRSSRSTVVVGRGDGMCDFALEFCACMYVCMYAHTYSCDVYSSLATIY